VGQVKSQPQLVQIVLLVVLVNIYQTLEQLLMTLQKQLSTTRQQTV
jgi:hypothetical protein